LCAHHINQALSRGRRFHSDKAVTCHFDKMAAFVLPNRDESNCVNNESPTPSQHVQG
jgi:hypothetical protein